MCRSTFLVNMAIVSDSSFPPRNNNDLITVSLFLGYVTDVLDDAKVYSSHGNKKSIDTEDVQLAVQCRMDHSFTTPPPRDVIPTYFTVSLFKSLSNLMLSFLK